MNQNETIFVIREEGEEEEEDEDEEDGEDGDGDGGEIGGDEESIKRRKERRRNRIRRERNNNKKKQKPKRKLKGWLFDSISESNSTENLTNFFDSDSLDSKSSKSRSSSSRSSHSLSKNRNKSNNNRKNNKRNSRQLEKYFFFGEISLKTQMKHGIAKEFYYSTGQLKFIGGYKFNQRDGFGKEFYNLYPKNGIISQSNDKSGNSTSIDGRRKEKRQGYFKYGLFVEQSYSFSDENLSKYTLEENKEIINKIKNPNNPLIFLKEGKMGKVYFVKNTNFAVKYINWNKQSQEDFLRESRLLSTLEHENIIRFHSIIYKEDENNKYKTEKEIKIDHFKVNSNDFVVGGSNLKKRKNIKKNRKAKGFVMDHCSKGDIAGIIRKLNYEKKTISWEMKLDILYQTSKGMKYLHEKKIIHYDLKWENVLLDKLNSVKVIDFGLSSFQLREIFEKYSNINDKHTQIKGTLNQIAPEIVNKGTLSAACDVFAFGIMIYELLRFTLNPYDRNTTLDFKNGFILYQKVASDPNFRPNLAKLRLKKDQKWIEKVIIKCWDADPTKRLTFAQICDIFFYYLNEKPIPTQDLPKKESEDPIKDEEIADDENEFGYDEELLKTINSIIMPIN